MNYSQGYNIPKSYLVFKAINGQNPEDHCILEVSFTIVDMLILWILFRSKKSLKNKTNGKI